MFASTNLVIELGILILIFLGWQFLIAEIIGGLVLIVISRMLITWTYPAAWLEKAKKKLEADSDGDMDRFDWRKRIRSIEGWRIVGHHFVDEWAMVWEEIVIGFAVAGFVAVLVPASFWQTIFLTNASAESPLYFPVVLQNVLLAPFVAAATFIGSMGNIPLATVLNSSGILFAGIMGFIYSDLMVPPLVSINARYYGWRVALYIAGIMYLSIVLTALILHYSFALADMIPQSSRVVEDIAQFKFDYTFWMNLAAIILVTGLWLLNRSWRKNNMKMEMDMGGGGKVKRFIAWSAVLVTAAGLISYIVLEIA